MLIDRITLALAAALTIPGCAPLRDVGEALDADEVRQVAVEIVAADNARDIERVLAFYADDAVLLPPNQPLVHGQDAIRLRYEGLFAAYDPAIEPVIEEVEIQGDLAYVRGHNGGVLHGHGDAADIPLDDTYLMILRRGGAGTWRITRLMWHATTPADSTAR